MEVEYSEALDFAEKIEALNEISAWLAPIDQFGTEFKALEIGGSGGILAGLFASRHGPVTCTDIVDWDSKYDGMALKLLRDKFSRNGHELPIDRMKYIPADAQELLFRDAWFDVVFSLNVFEHIPDPALAVREVVRVTKTGGLIYLRFDPVWTADSGSHFIHRIGEPWAHLLYDDDQIAERMRLNGASEDEVIAYRQDMNRLPAAYYGKEFLAIADELNCEVLDYSSWSGVADDSYLNHPYLAAAAESLQIPSSDLLIRGFRFVLRKN